MSRIFCLILCVLCADSAVNVGGFRVRRSSAVSGASSSSSSSSSSNSGGSYSTTGHLGQSGHGTQGSYSVSGTSGTPGYYGVSGSSGTPGYYGVPGGYGTPGYYGIPGGYGTQGSYAGSYPANFNFPSNNFPFAFSGTGGLPFPDFNALYNQFLAAFQAAQAHAAANAAYAPLFQQQLASLIAQQQSAMAQFPNAFPSQSVVGNSITHGTGAYPSGGTYHTGTGSGGASHSSSSSSSSTYPGGSSTYHSGTGSYPTGTYHGGSSYPSGSGTYHGGSSSGSYPIGSGLRQGGTGTYSGAPGAASVSGGPSSGNVHTSASVSLGPQGGFGEASAFPGGPDGLGVRIAEELPAPGGGSVGVFSSSSSGTSTVNGKTTSYKTSTFGTNNNGKITFRTVNE